MARAKNEEFNQIKYQNEFKKANYDRVEILVKKGERAIIKEIAAAGDKRKNGTRSAHDGRRTGIIKRTI